MTKPDGKNNSTKIEKPGITLCVASKKFNESNHDSQDFSSDSGPAIKMPSLNMVIGSNGSAPSSISTKFFVSAVNPFQSSSSDKQARGSIVSMELSDENGNPLSINNTKAPFVIRVPSPQPANAYQSSVNLVSFTYYKVNFITLIYMY